MMKRFLAIGVFLLCLMSAQFARADEKRDAQIKAEMVENYLLWQEAFKLQDAERIISFESPDFTHVVAGRKILSKTEFDTALRFEMGLTRKIYDAHAEIKKLIIEQSRIVVLSNQSLEYDEFYKSLTPSHISWTVQSRETWVQYDNVWMLKRIERPRIKVTVDGQTSLGR